jgi:hypothetical protein
MASSRKTPTLCERDTRQLWGTNLIHPLARDVKDTLLTIKKNAQVRVERSPIFKDSFFYNMEIFWEMV